MRKYLIHYHARSEKKVRNEQAGGTTLLREPADLRRAHLRDGYKALTRTNKLVPHTIFWRECGRQKYCTFLIVLLSALIGAGETSNGSL